MTILAPIQTAVHPSLPLRPSYNQILEVATDSEWQGIGLHKEEFICTPLSVVQPGGLVDFLFWNPLALTVHPWETLSGICGEFGAIAILLEPGQKIADWMIENSSGVHDIDLKMFYSPKDLQPVFGPVEMSEMVRKGYLSQKRRITLRADIRRKGAIRSREGTWFPTQKICEEKTKSRGIGFSIDDLKGNSVGSLGAMAESVGVTMNKDIKNPTTGKTMSKADMLEVLRINPRDFIRYAIEDASKLHEIRYEFNHRVSKLLLDHLGLDIAPNALKQTNGSLVADAFQQWIFQQHPGIPYAVTKLGLSSLGLTSQQALKQSAFMGEVENDIRNHGIESLLEMAQDDPEAAKRLKRYLRAQLETTGLKEASSAILGRERTTLAYSAMVQGGRAVNERPSGYLVEMGADIDLSGCYGSALAGFTYPLGLPSKLHYMLGETQMTLGEFLKKTERYMVPGLWQIVVTGGLKFSQDLIFSKKSAISRINRAATGFSEDTDLTNLNAVEFEVSRLGGEFAMIRKDIENGVITAEIIEALRKIASNTELKGFMGLKVQSAVWYDSRNQLETPEEWVNSVFQSRGQYTVEKGDLRSNKWVGVSIGGFIQPLLDERSRLKGLMRNAKGDEKSMFKSQQTLLKLFINTLYGCLASPFFTISNAVVANNITAKARLGAWMMAKALGSVQSITDGGCHPLRTVRFMSPSAKLPGFATLSAYDGWRDNKVGRTLGNLGGINWDGGGWNDLKAMGKDAAEKYLNALGLNHIKAFWDRYDLKFGFSVEYKGDNTFERMAYWNKTDYAILRTQFADQETPEPLMYEDSDGESHDVSRMTLKIRGEKFSLVEGGAKVAPKVELLINILSGSNRVPSKTEWVQTKLKTLTEWLKDDKADPNAQYLPGFEVEKTRGEAGRPLFRNHNQPADTFRIYERREKDKVGFDTFKSEGIVKLAVRMARENRKK